jgi:hypothetical protein
MLPMLPLLPLHLPVPRIARLREAAATVGQREPSVRVGVDIRRRRRSALYSWGHFAHSRIHPSMLNLPIHSLIRPFRVTRVTRVTCA